MADYVIAKYIRLSLDDSQSDSMSIENQKALLDRHIAELDIPNAETIELVDNGYSGTNFERPAVQELLELVRQGKVNCIAVKDFSRFGRNAIETGYFIERMFPLYRIRFISLAENFDSTDHYEDTGGLEVSFHFLKHEYYSRDLSQKIKSAMREKMRRGEAVTKNCAFGYKLDENRKMVIDDTAANIVRLIFELSAKNRSIAYIQSILYDEKYCTPSEYKQHKRRVKEDKFRFVWSHSAISLILHDEQYIGTYVAGKVTKPDFGSKKKVGKPESEWVKIPDHHPAIVDKAIFEKVRQKFNSKSINRKSGKSEQREKAYNPLKGKVICGCCGHVMQFKSAKKPSLQCDFAHISPDIPCYGLKIYAAELETTLFEIITKQAQIILNADSLSDIHTLDLCLERQSEYEKQIAKCQDKKRILYERLILKELGAEEYKSAKIEVDVELSRLNSALTAFNVETTRLSAEKSSDDKRHRAAESVSGEKKLTRELIDMLIDRVLVYPGNKIEIEWKIADFFSDVTI